MKILLKMMTVLFFVMLSTNVVFGAKAPTNKKKITPQAQYLTAKEAYEIIKRNSKNVLFIDVRTRAEMEFVGYTLMIDKNIPIKLKKYTKWNKEKNKFAGKMNKSFVKKLRKSLKAKGLKKKDHIILICRSGTRSAFASKILFKAGYKNVSTIVDGFEGAKDKMTHRRTVNGWKNAKLPWTYDLNKSQMYIK